MLRVNKASAVCKVNGILHTFDSESCDLLFHFHLHRNRFTFLGNVK